VTKLPVYRSTISFQNVVSFCKIKWDVYKWIQLSNLGPCRIWDLRPYILPTIESPSLGYLADVNILFRLTSLFRYFPGIKLSFCQYHLLTLLLRKLVFSPTTVDILCPKFINIFYLFLFLNEYRIPECTFTFTFANQFPVSIVWNKL
jgi:hypothetical protein